MRNLKETMGVKHPSQYWAHKDVQCMAAILTRLSFCLASELAKVGWMEKEHRRVKWEPLWQQLKKDSFQRPRRIIQRGKTRNAAISS